MTNVININSRNAKGDDDGMIEIYVCDCGSGLWRLYVDGRTECVNCTGMPAALKCFVDESMLAG